MEPLNMNPLDMKPLNEYIDHTQLTAAATQTDIQKLCDEAKQYSFKTVAINSYWVPFAATCLKGSNVGITACIGFPLGAASTASKAFEAHQAVLAGATEVDMVINVGELLAENYQACTCDIKAVVDAVPDTPVKVILECCLLDDEKIAAGCRCAMRAGGAFVKTSTGFSTGGATVHTVELMRQTVGEVCQVKAAGGIHSKEEAYAMIEAGADRIGASASIAICS